MSPINTANTRSVWIDPAIVALDVADTANLPNRGKDGGPNGADCSLS